jgi:hypothetical protein
MRQNETVHPDLSKPKSQERKPSGKQIQPSGVEMYDTPHAMTEGGNFMCLNLISGGTEYRALGLRKLNYYKEVIVIKPSPAD